MILTPAMDLSGIALIITAVFGGIVTVISTVTSVYLQIRAAKLAKTNKTEAIAARDEQNTKIDTVAASVNGHATEQTRLIVALKDEISRLSRPGAEATTEQKAGVGTEAGGALVGIDHGVVTVEHPRKEGDTEDDSTAA